MGQTLRSWQEIAIYVGKGLRTVQRWEHEIDFPVHRVGDNTRAVVASTDEINEWMRRSQKPTVLTPSVHPSIEERREQMEKLRQQVHRMCEQTSILREKVAKIKASQSARKTARNQIVVMEPGES